jgi:hypothetical protein
MYKINVSDSGDILGFYNTKFPKDIPEGCIEVDSETYKHVRNIKANKYIDGEFVRVEEVLTPEQIFENNIIRRKSAYKEESDPLMAEWLFDDDPEKELIWRMKVVEIKERYPIE